jgi:hypothetical protein
VLLPLSGGSGGLVLVNREIGGAIYNQYIIVVRKLVLVSLNQGLQNRLGYKNGFFSKIDWI